MRRLLSPPALFLVVAAALAPDRLPRAREAEAREARAMPAHATDTIRLDGSNGVMPLVAALVDAYRREQSGTVMVMGNGMGSGARIAALRERRIDIALASHGLDTAALSRDGFTSHRIATTAVVLGVNAGAPGREITSTQLCAVFTGSNASWSAVTGRPERVAMTVVARAESEVDMEVIRREVACLTSSPMAPHVQIAGDTDAMRQALLASPGAIGVTTATVVRQEGNRLRALALDGVAPTPEQVSAGRYRLVRDSYLVAAAAPSSAVSRFLAWVRAPDAQRIIAENGAIAIR